MSFIKTNLNPRENKTNDCVVRAIMKATGKTWQEVFDGLCEISRQDFKMPNSKDVFAKYLSSLGFIKMPMPKDLGRRIKLSIFAMTVGKDKTCVVSVVSHLVAVSNGNIYDTWDCSSKCVGNYWVKK